MATDLPDWLKSVQQIGEILDSGTMTTLMFGADVQLPPWCRTLLIAIPFSATLTPFGPLVSVTGDQSGFTYGTNTPPMVTIGTKAFWVVAVDPALDTSVTVNMAANATVATPINFTIAGSPFADDVLRFPSVPTQFASGAPYSLAGLHSNELPQASQTAALFETVAGTYTAIGAPPGNQAILITACMLVVDRSDLLAINCTRHGVAQIICALASSANGSQISRSWPRGVLLDAGTPVPFVLAGNANSYCIIEYDIVE